MLRRLSTLIALLVLAWPVLGQDDEDKAKARAEAVNAQKKVALEQWQGVLGGRMPAHKETDNLLIYGSVEEKDIDALAKLGEKALAQARKTLGVMPGDELWAGKLLVHVFAQRQEFGTYYRRYADRSPSQDETGTHSHEREHSYVLAGPPAGESKKPALEPEVVQQIASAVMTKKAGQLPDWFVSGFGRSVAYRLMPQQFAPERARATALMRRGKTAKDVWSGNLSADEGLVLNASFVDFLVNSPAMAKAFPEVMSNFGTETTFEDALKGAKLNPDAVAAAWWRWVPSAR